MCRLPGLTYNQKSGYARPFAALRLRAKAPSLRAWGAGGLAEKREKRLKKEHISQLLQLIVNDLKWFRFSTTPHLS